MIKSTMLKIETMEPIPTAHTGCKHCTGALISSEFDCANGRTMVLTKRCVACGAEYRLETPIVY